MILLVAALVASPGIVMGIEATVVDGADDAPSGPVVAGADRPAEAATNPDRVEDSVRSTRDRTEPNRDRPDEKTTDRPSRDDERSVDEAGDEPTTTEGEEAEGDDADEPAPIRAVAPELAVPNLPTEKVVDKLEALVESTNGLGELVDSLERPGEVIGRVEVPALAAPEDCPLIPDEETPGAVTDALDSALECVAAAPEELPETPPVPLDEPPAESVVTALVAIAAATSR